MGEGTSPATPLSGGLKKDGKLKETSIHKGFVFPGKDARLYVFRLRALKRGMEEKQLVRSKCDSRENKLEKTKGEVLGTAKLNPHR